MTYIGQSLISTFDFVWNRLGEPLSGLSDEDYFCRGPLVVAAGTGRNLAPGWQTPPPSRIRRR
jgi:hypothetical protein